MHTIRESFLFGSWMRKAHEISRMATGVNAFQTIKPVRASGGKERKKGADLEHLYVRHAEVEICGIAENEASREQEAYRQDGLYEHVFGHTNVIGAVE